MKNKVNYEKLAVATNEFLKALNEVIEAMKSNENVSKKNTEAKTEDSAKEDDKPPFEVYTKEDVRAALSKKAMANDGKDKAAVKTLVKKYGNGGTLTDVKESDYEALMKELEEL